MVKYQFGKIYNIPHKHFQVNKGHKLLDNFRIVSDSTGVMIATYIMIKLKE